MIDEPEIKLPTSYEGNAEGSVYDIETAPVEVPMNQQESTSDIGQLGRDQIEFFNPSSGGGGGGGGLPEGFEEVIRDYVKDDNTAGQEYRLAKPLA